MKILLTFIFLATLFFARAQKFSGQLENHDKGKMDIMLTMFGFDKLVKIGTLSAGGAFEIDLSGNPAESLSKDDLAIFIGKLAYGFQYVCGNPDDFPEGEPQIACDAGFIALWANNEWAGTLFPVTSEKLKLWLEDNGNNDAAEGSFYKVLLVTEEVELQKKCNNFDYYNDNEVPMEIEYDLKLKKGLNLVQYQIGSVYKTAPAIRASFPTKVKMTNAGENPPIIWMAKYFW